MERERIASRRHTKGDAGWQSAYSWYRNGFSSPAPPFFGGTPRDTRAAARCQETAESAIADTDAFGIVAHGVKPASCCAAMVLKGLAFLTPSTETHAAKAAMQGQLRQAGSAVQAAGASVSGVKIKRTRTRACFATPSITTGSKRHSSTASSAARSNSRRPLDRATITLDTWPSSSS